jgi:hypothetical protein
MMQLLKLAAGHQLFSWTNNFHTLFVVGIIPFKWDYISQSDQRFLQRNSLQADYLFRELYRGSLKFSDD